MNKQIATEAYVDVSRVAHEFGFRRPVMITQGLHAQLLPTDQETAAGESYLYRLGEVLSQALEAVRATRTGQSSWSFQVLMHISYASGQWYLRRLELCCCQQGKGYVIGDPQDLCG